MNRRLILASGSPQRADIMRELGLEFEALSMDVDEVVLQTPEATVEANAKLKAIAALRGLPDGRIVIAADTVLCVDGSILGKPKTPQRAREYLTALSGRRVTAVSAVAVARKGDESGWLATESATADVKTLTDDEIDGYVATGEPLERAVAIGISRCGEIFIEGIHGAYSCIAGLPKRALLAILGRLYDEKSDFLQKMPLVKVADSGNLEITSFKLR